jgi:hypothetical protein
MAPKGKAGKVAAGLYLLACVGVIAVAIAGREQRDTDIVVAYAMLLLAFPSAYVVVFVFGLVAQALHASFGIIVPGGVAPNVATVLILGGIGYAQWFILVPWLYRRVRGAI